MGNMCPVYKVNVPPDILLGIFKRSVYCFCLGDDCFLFRRKYWRHGSFSAKLYVAFISKDSVIYTDRPHTGLSKVFENLGIDFERRMNFLPSEVDGRIAKVVKKLQTFKY